MCWASVRFGSSAPLALAVVARLLVSPTVRCRGVGRALLQVAANNARGMGLRSILDVVVTYEAAIRLYESEGWGRVGTVQFPLPDGRTVDEHVYLSPIPATGPASALPSRGTIM